MKSTITRTQKPRKRARQIATNPTNRDDADREVAALERGIAAGRAAALRSARERVESIATYLRQDIEDLLAIADELHDRMPADRESDVLLASARDTFASAVLLLRGIEERVHVTAPRSVAPSDGAREGAR